MNDRFQEPDAGMLEGKLKEIKNCWREYLTEVKNCYNRENSLLKSVKIKDEVNDFALKEMICRVAARRDYFYRYHDGMVMSEYKEIGLNMFWLVKFQPFAINVDYSDEEDNVADILKQDANLVFQCNENFAVFYMLSALKNYQARSFPELIFSASNLSNQFIDELVYSLKVRDVSKEAMGLIVELVAELVIEGLSKNGK